MRQHATQETLATYEMNLDRATDHNAQMMGHVNPKPQTQNPEMLHVSSAPVVMHFCPDHTHSQSQ